MTHSYYQLHDQYKVFHVLKFILKHTVRLLILLILIRTFISHKTLVRVNKNTTQNSCCFVPL